MCCNHKSVDLSLLNDVLEHYADVKGSLITILQKTQDIYGYVPIDAVYHIAERTGLTPAKIMGVYDRKGSLEKDKDADIVILDDNLNVRAVWSMGKVVEGTFTI